MWVHPRFPVQIQKSWNHRWSRAPCTCYTYVPAKTNYKENIMRNMFCHTKGTKKAIVHGKNLSNNLESSMVTVVLHLLTLCTNRCIHIYTYMYVCAYTKIKVCMYTELRPHRVAITQSFNHTELQSHKVAINFDYSVFR